MTGVAPSMDEVDVAIVGGGAAGVAALRRLAEAGKKVLLLEALDRLGGRAHTVHIAGLPIDMGAGWLHSAPRNPWVPIAEARGFELNRALPRWREQWREAGFPKAEQEAAWATFRTFSEALQRQNPPGDRAEALRPEDPSWHPYLDALSGVINGAAIAEMSAADWAAYDAASREVDWRVIAGYGALVSSHAAGLPVALATPVTAIDSTESRLRIETPRGTLRAGAAIVTVSTNVLASGAIALPGHDPVLHAASRLPLGLADKLFFALDRPEDVDADAHLLGNPHTAMTGAYTLRPFGRPIVEYMIGGIAARALEKEGLDGAANFAIEELCSLLGSEWRGRLRLIAGSAWGRETHILGGYSHALPGAHAERQVLRTPIDPRIHFAGEACSDADFSTAHGSYETGIAAAEALLAGREPA